MSARRTLRRIAAIGAMVVALAGCSGPKIPLEVDAKQFPVDILLGSQRTPAPPPPAGSDAGPIGFPGFLQPPAPRPLPGLLPPPDTGPINPCPAANPNDPSLLVARLTAIPPAPATYVYGNSGTIKTGDAVSVEYPPTTTRTVQNVKPGTDGFDYDVAATVAGATTTTTYRVRTGGQTPDRGISIVQIVTRDRQRTQSFTPSTPILLLPFPSPEYGTNLEDELDQYRGQRYRSAGTDPISQTTMVLEATLTGKHRVDACGEWIDAFDVEVLTGSIIAPGRQLDFTGHYRIAPQYGTLIVEDDLLMTGTDGGVAVRVQNRSSIRQVPRDPATQPST